VKYLAPPPENTLAPVPRPFAAADGKPASDAEFEVYRRLYGYDKSALNARVEAAEDAEHWRRERATIDATYGRERFAVQLYLPKSTKPPYQAVVWLGGGDVLELPSSDHPGSQFLFDFVVRTGRAVVLPVLQGTYERRPTANAPRGANTAREMAIQRSSDLGRTIDYLETRSDFDRQRVAYYGLSYGANLGQLLVPLEPRITTAVLLAAGLQGGRIAPERDPVSFVPRFRVPTLMIGGRDDFLYPVNTHQKPLFDLLAAPRDRKKHVVLDGVGHMIPPRADVIREVLAWFDAYLGPVERR
jgi:dienelactone hydrolase